MKNYIETNKDRFFEELFSLLRIPSISSLEENRPDMRACAERLVELLKEAGADEAAVYETDGHPVVFGQKTVSADAVTVLVYGHYDVQPVDPLELWTSDPFEPEIRDGLLRHNVKFILEGEEEIGSPSLAKWAEEHKELLAADIILVSDTTMISEAVPSINCGMRGLSYVEVKVTGPDKDLHSGHYGGAVANQIGRASCRERV